MERIEVVVAHEARVTLRVGDTFLKVDSDQANLDAEVATIGLAPIPTPRILWRQPSVLAIGAVPGTALGRLGEPSPASAAAWSAAGQAARKLHDTPPPSWPSRSPLDLISRLDEECERLIGNGLLPRELVERNRELAQAALNPHRQAFIHGDLQLTHVFVEHDQVVGVIDWSEGGQGDPMFDLATLTLGHEEHLDDVLTGYGPGADRAAIMAWWSLRSLTVIRWLAEHGFDPFEPGAEVDVLRARR